MRFSTLSADHISAHNECCSAGLYKKYIDLILVPLNGPVSLSARDQEQIIGIIDETSGRDVISIPGRLGSQFLLDLPQ